MQSPRRHFWTEQKARTWVRIACQSRDGISCHAESAHQQLQRATASKLRGLMPSRRSMVPAGDLPYLDALGKRHRVLPPPAWMAIEARLQRETFADPGLILQQGLSPRRYIVPDVDGAAACRCTLTLRGWGQRFRQPDINAFLVRLFCTIVKASGNQVRLSRFDLFHGHVFASRQNPSRLGVLFHAMEYPAYGPEFDIDLGFCQTDSPLTFRQDLLDARNWLYFQGRLVSLQMGTESVLHTSLLLDGLGPLRTVLEDDFGLPLCDVYYFPGRHSGQQLQDLFVCPLRLQDAT